MSYYIIIRGPLGSGKSTISEKLAHILEAKHVHMDEVLEKHGLDKMPPDAPCIPAENFIKANEIVLPEVKKLLAGGKIVIFDACFYHKEVIEHLVQNIEMPHYIFTLKAPLELCIKRDSERHKTHGEGAARAVHSLVSRFDYGNIVDVTGSLEDALKDILSYLPTPKN
ncbi:AAA family ATPase [Candidatus Peregrinibacteria bacterium]|nr:AAA family ATPase [Candidatus Peregrinibacteria bacterium]